MATEFRRPEDILVVRLCAHSFDPEAVQRLVASTRLDWRYVVDAARTHAVGARLFERALALPLPESARAAIAVAAKTTLKEYIHDNAIFLNEVGRLRRVFAAASIDWMLLRGLSLDPTMTRPAGDIDILVRRDRLVDAIEAVLRLPGYSYEDVAAAPDRHNVFREAPLTDLIRARIRRQAASIHEFHLFDPERGVLVELLVRMFAQPVRDQTTLWKGAAASDALADRIWTARRSLARLQCEAPTEEHSLLIMCLQVALHRSLAANAFRLGNLVDIDNLASSAVRWDLFARDTIELGLSPFVSFSLSLSRRLLGTPVPATVLSEFKASCTPLQRTVARLHLRSIGTLESSNRFYGALCRAVHPWALSGPLKDCVKGALFAHILFPERKTMAAFLGVSIRSPLLIVSYALNPLRWLALVMRKVFRMRDAQSM